MPADWRSRVSSLEESQEDIARECDALKEMLLSKNRRYGNSALDIEQVFSRLFGLPPMPPWVGILYRLNDKYLRLKNLEPNDTEDTLQDMIGYLVLLKIARSREGL
jgi:hypothetical protein